MEETKPLSVVPVSGAGTFWGDGSRDALLSGDSIQAPG